MVAAVVLETANKSADNEQDTRLAHYGCCTLEQAVESTVQQATGGKRRIALRGAYGLVKQTSRAVWRLRKFRIPRMCDILVDCSRDIPRSFHNAPKVPSSIYGEQSICSSSIL